MSTARNKLDFPGSIEAFVRPGLFDELTSVERGVLYSLLRAAWDRMGWLSLDERVTLTRAGLVESDLPVVRMICETCTVATTTGLKFPLLADRYTRDADKAKRLSELQSQRRRGKAAEQRLRLADDSPDHEPPDPPPVHRRSTGGEPVVDQRWSSGSLRSSSSPAPCAQTNTERQAQSAAPVSSSTGGAQGAKTPIDWDEVAKTQDTARRAKRDNIRTAILKLSIRTHDLSPADKAKEMERRGLVWRRLVQAQFPAVSQNWCTIPEDSARLITLAPWVTEKLVAGHIWEAMHILKDRPAGAPPFNPVGYVITMCGTATHTLQRPAPTPFNFEKVWASQMRERADAIRAEEARRAVQPTTNIAGGGA